MVIDSHINRTYNFPLEKTGKRLSISAATTIGEWILASLPERPTPQSSSPSDPQKDKNPEDRQADKCQIK